MRSIFTSTWLIATILCAAAGCTSGSSGSSRDAASGTSLDAAGPGSDVPMGGGAPGSTGGIGGGAGGEGSGGLGGGGAGGTVGQNEGGIGTPSGDAPPMGNAWTVTSPSGRLAIDLSLVADGVSGFAAGSLAYRVRLDQKEVVGLSSLGIERDDQSFVDGLELVTAGENRTVRDDYRAVHGKRLVRQVTGGERTITFKNKGGAKVEIVLRAHNDGVAFRYRFPETDATAKTVRRETTSFQIPAGALGYMQPHDDPGQYTPGYETFFKADVPVGTAAPNLAGWSFPLLFQLQGGTGWVLVTEAGVDESYCGSRIAQTASGGLYRLRFPDAGEGNNLGAVEPTWTLPWATPWRVIQASDKLAGIVESTLIEDLNPPTAIADTTWIKPGRASWSWWSDQVSSKDAIKLRAFIDFAAAMGWEYSLVDANWNTMGDDVIQGLVTYAAAKNVGLLLWYNSGGKGNIITEQPRDRMDNGDIRRQEMKKIHDWGIKGIKVDFFQSDKQNTMAEYIGIMKDAAANQLLVNFHGCTTARGWSRTYPNLMTMEGVRGAEYYHWDPLAPAAAPSHLAVIPFTRNIGGGADYTPVTFTSAKYAHLTTYGAELALSVVLQSSLLHFADSVAAYQGLADVPKQFLKDVPTSWEDTRLVVGEPGKVVVIARLKAGEWWLGGLNADTKERRLSLPLAFLTGPAACTVIEDGATAKSLQSRTAAAATTLDVVLPANGGFTARCKP